MALATWACPLAAQSEVMVRRLATLQLSRRLMQARTPVGLPTRWTLVSTVTAMARTTMVQLAVPIPRRRTLQDPTM
jgi:hypothetical protein